ncbi:hypothetical protein B0H13DRAFT_2347789 [Mycena leptocephala]|nr:hypothetical protein B0H13DRAFT_2347789 [Mycena leptocephala]
MHIPIIDLCSSSQDEIVQKIRCACETVGIFYIENHGISQEVIQRCLDTSAEFFSLGDDAKMLLWQEDPISVNSATVLPATPKSIKAWEELCSESRGNKWPAGLPALREAVLDYYTRALELGKVLYRLIALAMGFKEDFFADKTRLNVSRMRLLRYPAQSKEVIGSGAHTDFGTFTILLQQPGIEALQVAAPKTGWMFIPSIPGRCLGDQSSSALVRGSPSFNYTPALMDGSSSDGVFRSPLHRVVSCPGPVRHSIPLFFLADMDVVLQPDEAFVTPDRPRQYAPRTAGEHLAQRVASSRAEQSGGNDVM